MINAPESIRFTFGDDLDIFDWMFARIVKAECLVTVGYKIPLTGDTGKAEVVVLGLEEQESGEMWLKVAYGDSAPELLCPFKDVISVHIW